MEEHGKEETEKPSFANVVRDESKKRKVIFRLLETNLANKEEGIDLIFPREVVQESCRRFSNTLYGYFLGDRLPFPVVDRYASNVWRKFGLEKTMMNSSGFFYFKFASYEGMVKVLEEGPWMIRNMPIFLKQWSPDVCMVKANITNVLGWIKMHDVPLVGYTDDGLLAIATKIGKPIMLDSYTSNMCVNAWGRPSFAGAMIEVSSETMLKDKVVIAIPKLESIGYNCYEMKVEYEWRSPRCSVCKVFGHVDDGCPKKVNKTKPKEARVVEEGFKQAKQKKNKRFNVGPPKVEYIPKVKPSDQPILNSQNQFVSLFL